MASRQEQIEELEEQIVQLREGAYKLSMELSERAWEAHNQVMAPVDELYDEIDKLRDKQAALKKEELVEQALDLAGEDSADAAVRKFLKEANELISRAMLLKDQIDPKWTDFKLDIGFPIYLGGPRNDSGPFDPDKWYPSYSTDPI